MEAAYPIIGGLLGGYDSIRKRNQALANRKIAAGQAYGGGEVPQEILYGQLPSFLLDTAQGALAGAGQGQAAERFDQNTQSQDLWNENMRAKTDAYKALAESKQQLDPEEYRQFKMWRSTQKIKDSDNEPS